MLLVIGYWSLVIGYWLLVIGCLLFAVCCLQPMPPSPMPHPPCPLTMFVQNILQVTSHCIRLFHRQMAAIWNLKYILATTLEQKSPTTPFYETYSNLPMADLMFSNYFDQGSWLLLVHRRNGATELALLIPNNEIN
ncbi:MAG: hypothetical protein U7126_06825 [Microcoleus sp.]